MKATWLVKPNTFLSNKKWGSMHQSYALRRHLFFLKANIYTKSSSILPLWPCQVRKIPGSGTGSFLGRWDSPPPPTNWNEEPISWSHRHFSWYLGKKTSPPQSPIKTTTTKKTHTHTHILLEFGPVKIGPSPKPWFTVPRLVVNFGKNGARFHPLKCFIPESRTWKLTAGTPNVMKLWMVGRRWCSFSNRWWL